MGTQKKMSLSIEFESHFQWVLSLGFELSDSFLMSFELKLKTQTQYSNLFFFEYPCMVEIYKFLNKRFALKLWHVFIS